MQIYLYVTQRRVYNKIKEWWLMQKSNKHEQIQAIKQRLNDALNRSKLNINQLTDAINESNDIEVNYGTVRNVLESVLKPSK